MYSGAKFGKLDFNETLIIGSWPNGMVIEEHKTGDLWRVIGSIKRRIRAPECGLREEPQRCCCNCHWQYEDLVPAEADYSWICLQPINPGKAVSGQQKHGRCGQWADWYKVHTEERMVCLEKNQGVSRQRFDL